ncbi:uncharacterized protein LOC126661630 [Mercurialis annua]|uniref:uncharacterized protein LOC126661630 n=1 Tax=Mercurialis annua TaxID=3986 RepID=UPI002160DCD0|nr:uncharacterized protein LOC126661630 [Mercurialis annua]
MESDKESIWYCVILNSSCISSWFDLESPNIMKLSHLWKGIIRSCVKNKIVWDCFINSVSVTLGTGSRIRFWKDNWLETPLLNQFPELFRLNRNKDGIISSFLNSDQPGLFDFSWSRRLRIGEQHQLFLLVHQLPRPDQLLQVEDKFVWRRNKSFTSASMTELLFLLTANQHQISSVLLLRVWKERLPPRIQFFVWLLARDRISSKESLVSRGIIDQEQSYCLLCAEVESELHIVLHYMFAWKFWSFILLDCGITWVPPLFLDGIFIQWTSLSVGRYKNFWKLVWYFGIWNLWKARNKWMFQHATTDIKSLVFSMICKSVEFYKDQHHDFPYSERCLSLD